MVLFFVGALSIAHRAYEARLGAAYGKRTSGIVDGAYKKNVQVHPRYISFTPNLIDLHSDTMEESFLLAVLGELQAVA